MGDPAVRREATLEWKTRAAQVPMDAIWGFCDTVRETVEMSYSAIKPGLIPCTGHDAPLFGVIIVMTVELGLINPPRA